MDKPPATNHLNEGHSPFLLQIALQGGGAKLSVILAAMESVQKLQRQNIIKVTSIAGTSAGSIVACLFAADIDLSKVRERLKAYTKDDWDNNLSNSKLNAVWKLGRGQSLWSTKWLEDELEYFFFKENSLVTLEDIKNKSNITPIVVATDLSQSKKIVYRNDENIKKAILDSCAIPYCFRVWDKSGNPVIVDGGICENFPSEELDPNEDKFGTIIGISFEEFSTAPPDSLQSFTYSLLNTAINHSIYRAKRRLGSDRVFSIKTKINTFDFPNAFSDSSDAEYNKVKKEAEEFLSNVIDNPKPPNTIEIAPDEWETQSKEYMAKLSRIYETQHLKNKLKYIKGRLEVKGASLEGRGESDFVQYSLVFKTLNSPIYCHQFALSKTDADFFLKKAEFLVYHEETAQPVEVIYVPLETIKNDGTEQKNVLIFFIPELEPNSGPYTLKCSDTIQNFVGSLRDNNHDFLRVRPFRAAGNIDEIEVVLHAPRDFPDIVMMQQENLGAKMSAFEMARSNFSKYPNYKSFGWKAKDLAPDKPFKVDLIVES